jgi:hypothetical protein
VSPKKLRLRVQRCNRYVGYQGKNACCVALVGRMSYEWTLATRCGLEFRTPTGTPWRKLQYDAFAGSKRDETN